MMTKSERAHLEFLADHLQTIAGCTDASWQEAMQRPRNDSILRIAAALRSAAQKKTKRTQVVPAERQER